MNDKEGLRMEARAKLGGLSAEYIARMAERVDAAVWSIPEITSAGVLLLYAAIGTEVSTDSIALEARRRGIQVVYPRCLPDSRAMTLHSVAHDDQLLHGGSYGIREPEPACPTVTTAAIDAAFLPGLGWDREGHRLGRGAGYYDRLLADPGWRAFRCGLFFAIQEFTAIPTDPWDRKLDAVVTEREIVRVRG